MELLAGAPTPSIEQLLLPLGEEDPLADEEPVAALSVPGLADPSRERRWLEAIAEAARAAANSETKMRYLLRLLDRVGEPVIVFTEYRDTLARLRRRIAATGRPIAILHGGMTSAERTEVVRLFTNGMPTLLATDAAAEGLNLHHRCRVVVHYELPWNPARLEQRAGRVDRIGQVRRVHEMALVAAATAERLVIAPLAARASRARSRRGGSQLLDALTESRVADAVMSGILPDLQRSGSASRTSSDDAFGMDLRVESEQEVRRLERERAFIARSRRGLSSRGGAVVSRLRRVATHTDEGLILVYAVALESNVGRRVHAQPVIVQVLLQRVAIQTVNELRALARLFAVPPDTHLSALLHDTARQAVEEATQLELRKRACVSLRVQAMARDCAAAARRLVQPGLFDRRALRERERRRASSEQTESFLDDTPLRTEISLVAALHLPSRARLP
jgi:hypothetical protein